MRQWLLTYFLGQNWSQGLSGGLVALVAKSDPRPLFLCSRIAVGQWVLVEGEGKEEIAGNLLVVQPSTLRYWGPSDFIWKRIS